MFFHYSFEVRNRAFSISSWLSTIMSFLAFMRTIMLACLWWVVALWKKEEFLSPSLSHLFLDLDFQRISSCFSLLSKASSNVFSSSFVESMYPSSMVVLWRVASCLSSCTFSKWMLPKRSMFQTLTYSLMYFNFCWNWYIRVPSRGWNSFDHCCMRGWKYGWESQNFSKWKGLLICSPCIH